MRGLGTLGRRSLPSWQVLLLLLALGASLVRARNQPSVGVPLGQTTASVVPADICVAVLAVVTLVFVRRLRPGNWLLFTLVAAAAFCALILATAAANGSTAFVAGAKAVEPAVLGLAAAVFVRTRRRLEDVILLLVGFTILADLVAIKGFATSGGRQASFLGEHDFAALATLTLLYGLLRVGRSTGALAWVALVTGAVGCMLGAALASLLGLYLGAAAIVIAAALRRDLGLRRLALILAVLAAVTAGTLELRSGDLGFLQSWFGKPAERPGQYASSWSQRLIYAYVGGRIFLAHPLAGTGWYGNLPPSAFATYLPDARRRFPDQPPRYFPPATDDFVPQQAYDQVLYELGIAGAAAFVALLGAIVVGAIRAARRLVTNDALLPIAWTASILGALAGEGLFGGTPLIALLWLVAGITISYNLWGESLK